MLLVFSQREWKANRIYKISQKEIYVRDIKNTYFYETHTHTHTYIYIYLQVQSI